MLIRHLPVSLPIGTGDWKLISKFSYVIITSIVDVYSLPYNIYQTRTAVLAARFVQLH